MESKRLNEEPGQNPKSGPPGLAHGNCAAAVDSSLLHSKELGLRRRETDEGREKESFDLKLCSGRLPRREPKCSLIHANGLHRKFLLRKWRSESTTLGEIAHPKTRSISQISDSSSACLTVWNTGNFSALNLTIWVYYYFFKTWLHKRRFLSSFS